MKIQFSGNKISSIKVNPVKSSTAPQLLLLYDKILEKLVFIFFSVLWTTPGEDIPRRPLTELEMANLFS